MTDEEKREQEIKQEIKDDRQFYYDLSKFEVQAIAQRNQIMLVFQSMLFAAMAVSAGKQNLFFPLWLLMAMGILTSFVWLYLNWLTYVVENKAMKELEIIDHRIKNALSSRNNNWLLRIGSVSKIMSFGFPLLVLVSWLALIIFYYCRYA